jgi:hypothetical protein
MAEESTTPDVVELLRSGFDALNRRDFDAIPRIFAVDAVYDLSSAGLGIYDGLTAIRALFEDWWSAYDELGSELEEVVDLGLPSSSQRRTADLRDRRSSPARRALRRARRRWCLPQRRTPEHARRRPIG